MKLQENKNTLEENSNRLDHSTKKQEEESMSYSYKNQKLQIKIDEFGKKAHLQQ